MGADHFIRLSALLANITKNSTYFTAAQYSFDFAYSNLVDHTSGLITEGVNATNCSPFPFGEYMAYSALALESAAILGVVANNASIQDM